MVLISDLDTWPPKFQSYTEFKDELNTAIQQHPPFGDFVKRAIIGNSEIDKIIMFKTPIKGELTIVISEKNIKDKTFDEMKIIKKAKLYLKKYSLKDVVELLFETEKINKKKIYQICLNIKKNEKNY